MRILQTKFNGVWRTTWLDYRGPDLTDMLPALAACVGAQACRLVEVA